MLVSPPVQVEQVVRLPDEAARAAAEARLQAFNQTLLSHPSATAVLQQWCDAHSASPAPRIVARRVRGIEKSADADVRARLGVGASEPVRYRRVELACGDRVLSKADNWYRPARLTPEMNRLLDETETPFGAAAKALNFSRRNLTATVLFRPMESRGPVTVPPQVLRQSALLSTPDGAPLALVVETYTGEVLKSGF